MQKVFNFLVFVVFFTVGAGAVSCSLLCGEILSYYENKNYLIEAEGRLEKLRNLNEDYEILLKRLQSDPNLIERVGSVTLAEYPNEPNTVRPRTSPGRLAKVRSILKKMDDEKNSQIIAPRWIKRVNQPNKRTALFLAGTFLVLISLVFFNAPSVDEIEDEDSAEELQ